MGPEPSHHCACGSLNVEGRHILIVIFAGYLFCVTQLGQMMSFTSHQSVDQEFTFQKQLVNNQNKTQILKSL